MNKIRTINQGDILLFKANDDRYKAILCTGTYKERSPHHFTFAAKTINAKEKPSLNEILSAGFFGIGNRKADFFNYLDEEVRKMWHIHPEIAPYHLGSYGLTIWRKDFMKFRQNLELAGHIEIVNHLDKNGDSGVNASSWDFLKNFFTDFENILSKRDQKVFKLEAIIKA